MNSQSGEPLLEVVWGGTFSDFGSLQIRGQKWLSKPDSSCLFDWNRLDYKPMWYLNIENHFVLIFSFYLIISKTLNLLVQFERGWCLCHTYSSWMNGWCFILISEKSWTDFVISIFKGFWKPQPIWISWSCHKNTSVNCSETKLDTQTFIDRLYTGWWSVPECVG